MFLKLNGLFIPKSILKGGYVFWIMIVICFYPDILQSQEKEEKSILILYSLSQSFPAVVQWDSGIRSTFNAHQDLKININTEYLDLSRYYDQDYIEKIRDVFEYKYAEDQPDLIITVLEPAMDFLLNHREALFPEVPMLSQ